MIIAKKHITNMFNLNIPSGFEVFCNAFTDLIPAGIESTGYKSEVDLRKRLSPKWVIFGLVGLIEPAVGLGERDENRVMK